MRNHQLVGLYPWNSFPKWKWLNQSVKLFERLKKEKERTGITSNNCKNLPPSIKNLHRIPADHRRILVPVGPYLHKGHWPQLEGASEVSQLLLSLPETRENSVDCTYGADHQHRLERLMVHVF